MTISPEQYGQRLAQLLEQKGKSWSLIFFIIITTTPLHSTPHTTMYHWHFFTIYQSLTHSQMNKWTTTTKTTDVIKLYKVLLAIKENIEIAYTSEYRSLLMHVHDKLLLTLRVIEPEVSFVETADEQQRLHIPEAQRVRNTVLEILLRLPCNEVCCCCFFSTFYYDWFDMYIY